MQAVSNLLIEYILQIVILETTNCNKLSGFKQYKCIAL